MAEFDLGTYGSKIVLDDSQFTKGMDNAEKKSSTFGSKVGKIAGGAVLGLTGAIAAGGAAMFGLANKAADATDRIDKMSQKLGLSREGFQEWDFILSQNGASIDSMGSGIKTLTNQVDELSKGGKVATDAFGALGMSYDDLARLSQEEIFEKTISALQGVEDESKRAAIANDLLGRSGQELAPLLNAGADSVESMKQQAHDLGLVMGDDAIDAGVQFTDTMDQLKRSMSTAFSQIGVTVMPLLQKLASWITSNMPTIQSIMSTVFGVIQTVIGTVVEVISNVITWLQTWFQNNQSTIEGIKQGFMEFVEIVVGLIQGFVELATNIWNTYGDQIMTVISTAFEVVKTVFQTAFQFIKDIFLVFTALFKGDWAGLWDAIKTMLSNAWDNISKILDSAFEFIGNIIDLAWTGIKDFFKGIWDGIVNIFKNALDNQKKRTEESWNKVKSIATNVWNGIKDFFINIWNGIKKIFTDAIENQKKKVEESWNKIKSITESVFGGIKNFFTGIWDGIISGVDKFKSLFLGVWDKIKSGIKSVINPIIGFINGLISGLEKMVNGLGSAINKIPKFKVPDWIPGIGGGSFGLPEVPTISLPKIPSLATGGVAFKPTLAQIGDAGFRNPEIVAPQKMLTDIFEKSLKNHGNINNNQNITVSPTLNITLESSGYTEKDAERIGKYVFKQMNSELGNLGVNQL